MKFWTSVILILFVVDCFVLSAPAKKEDTTKSSTNSSTKIASKPEEQKATPEVKNKDDGFNVPSSQLDNGQMIKAASLTHETSADSGFLEKESNKLSSDKDKKTEAKLLRMVFDGKDKKSDGKETSDDKHKAEKKDGKHKSKNRSKSHFNVFKVIEGGKKHDKPDIGKLKHKHHPAEYYYKHKGHHDYDDEKRVGYYGRKRPRYMDYAEDYYEETYDKGYDDYDYIPRKRHRDRHSKHGYHKKPHRHYSDYKDDDDEEADYRKGSENKPHEYRVTKTFKPNVSPSDFGFDKEHMESVFGHAFRPGGFGAESMKHMGRSGKLLSAGYDSDDY